MGQALQRAAQWTSAKGGSGGKLEFTKINEELLNSIINFVDGFGAKYPEEAQLAFKKPLTWTSSLKPNQMKGQGMTDQGEDLVSEATAGKDLPLFCLKKHDQMTYNASVMNMHYAEEVLRAAGDKKMHEVRACLEANRDPVANMLGDRFATVEGDDNSIFRFMEEITKEQEMLAKQSAEERNEDRVAEIEEMKSILKFRLCLQRLDQQLMDQSITIISKEVRLTPVTVDGEVSILRELCGNDDDSTVLERLEYWEPPAWRKTGNRRQNKDRKGAWMIISYILLD